MEKYGIIGHPLGHSFSRAFFTEKFEREGLDAVYTNYDIASISELPRILRENPELRGLNVTIPYKQDVIPLLNAISDEAREIGAVNVVRIDAKGLKGFNSDIIGFMDSIRPLLRPWHKRALVLGTGGASKAITAGLRKLGVEPTLVSRHPKEGQLGYNKLDKEVMDGYKVVVNCSPVGTFPKSDECPRIPYQLLTERHLLYDLVYNPEKTLFLQKGAERGATVKNGLEMLHRQAVASWEFWHTTD